MADRRIVLITGASRGIGAEVARLLGARQYRLALVARDRTQLQQIADDVTRAGGEALVYPADFSLPGQARAAVEATIAQYGRLDVLVNNAGYGMEGYLEAIPMEEITRLFAVNLFAVMEATQAALPAMRAQRAGHIINVASMAAYFSLPFNAVYSASKAALSAFSTSLRAEVSPFGIHVSVDYPSVTETPFFGAVRSFFRHTADHPNFPIPVQSAVTVAQGIVRAIDHPHPAIFPFPGSRAAIVLATLWPGLSNAIMTRQGRVAQKLQREGFLDPSQEKG